MLLCVSICFPGSLHILVWFDGHIRIIDGVYICKSDEEFEVASGTWRSDHIRCAIVCYCHVVNA
jgi:hypothetical protein